MAIRRIVTGVNSEGRGRFASDGPVIPKTAPSLPGVGMYYVWGADRKETVPTDGSEPAWSEHFPPLDGYRVIVCTLPPGTAGRDEPMSAEEIAAAEAAFPGLHSTFDESKKGMHVSVTVDVGIILAGSVDLELDDGNIKHLKVGDIVIQNGTLHSWTNAGESEAAIAFILMGAHGPK
jgi:hypothetical protein